MNILDFLISSIMTLINQLFGKAKQNEKISGSDSDEHIVDTLYH
jgi:hypothetical protein